MKHALAVLFVCSAIAAAATPDYNLKVHVAASRMVLHGTALAHLQCLSVVIDGKKYELESLASPNSLLKPGDYRARIVKDQPSGESDVWRIYEIQFPDKKVRQFLLVGILE